MFYNHSIPSSTNPIHIMEEQERLKKCIGVPCARTTLLVQEAEAMGELTEALQDHRVDIFDVVDAEYVAVHDEQFELGISLA